MIQLLLLNIKNKERVYDLDKLFSIKYIWKNQKFIALFLTLLIIISFSSCSIDNNYELKVQEYLLEKYGTEFNIDSQNLNDNIISFKVSSISDKFKNIQADVIYDISLDSFSDNVVNKYIENKFSSLVQHYFVNSLILVKFKTDNEFNNNFNINVSIDDYLKTIKSNDIHLYVFRYGVEVDDDEFDFIYKSTKRLLKDYKKDFSFEVFYLDNYNKKKIINLYSATDDFSNDILSDLNTIAYSKFAVKNHSSKGIKEQMIRNYRIKKI